MRLRLTFEDWVGHGGYALLLGGMTLVASKLWIGWPVYILGDLVWVWVGWRLRLSSVWLWQGAFVLVALHGWWTWTR